MSLGEQFEPVLTAARTGADWAIATLYREMHPRIFRYLRAHEPADGEDLASDVWLDAANGLARFEGGEADFRRWMFTIARRRLIDHRRQRARRRTDPVPSETLADRAEAGDVEERVLTTVATERALLRIAALPGDQSDVVLLRLVGGLEVEEVAQITGKRPGTVRVLQHRALKRLARELAPEVLEVTTDPRMKPVPGTLTVVPDPSPVTDPAPDAMYRGDEGASAV